MGFTYMKGTASGPSGEERELEFLVDSGAGYTVLPHGVWQALGLAPKRTLGFTLADGTPIERQVSECRIALDGDEGHTMVILGEPGDLPLLGAYTLEGFFLVLNPYQRTLQAMKLRL